MFRQVILTNSYLQKSVVIDESSDEYVLDEDGLNISPIEATHNLTQYINLIGSHLNSTALNPRNIQLLGWVIGKDEQEIQNRKLLLNKLINPLHNIVLTKGAYVIEFQPDTSIQYSTNYRENNEVLAKFQIQGTAFKPYWRLVQPNVYRKSVDLQQGFSFPLVITKNKGVIFGYYPIGSIADVDNFGDLEVGFLLRYQALGTVVNPEVQNVDTKESIVLNCILDEGDLVELCTEQGNQYVTIRRNNGSVENGLNYLTSNSKIDMLLKLGKNSLEMFADSGKNELEVQLSFSPRFLEIEGEDG